MGDDKDNSRNNLNRWVALSGIGVEMGVTIFVCAWIGKKLDRHFNIEKNWFTVGFVLFGVAASIFMLVKELKYLNKNHD